MTIILTYNSKSVEVVFSEKALINNKQIFFDINKDNIDCGNVGCDKCPLDNTGCCTPNKAIDRFLLYLKENNPELFV